jgi:hypothetical protein
MCSWIAGEKRKGTVELIAYIQQRTQDETPVKLRARHLDAEFGLLALEDEDKNEVARLREMWAVLLAQMGAGIDNRNQLIAKVIQYEVVESFLLKLPGTQEYTLVTAEMPARLMVYDSITGDSLYQSFKEICPIPLKDELQTEFELDSCLTHWDRGSPCGRLTKILLFLLPHVLILDAGLCAAHCLHTIQGRTMNVIQVTFSGLVALLLAERNAGAVPHLRTVFEETLLESAVPRRHEQLPRMDADFLQAKHALFELVFPVGDLATSMRRKLLDFALQCDFSSERVPVYVGSLHEAAIAPYLRSWAKATAAAILPNQHKMFARHRWILSFHPVLEVLLCMAALGLLGRCAREWVKRLHARPGVAQAAPRPQAAAGIPEAAAAGARSAETDVVPVGAAVGDAIVEFDARLNEVALLTGALTSEQYRQRNAQNQDKAIDFAEDPMSFPFLCLACVAMRTIYNLMQHVLYLDSEKWEQKQQTEADKGRPRTYRLFEAVSGNATATFYEESIKVMCSCLAWAILRPEHRTGLTRSMAFAMLSMQLGGVWLFLDFVWSKYPWREWSMLVPGADTRGIAWVLFRDPHCLWAEFTHRHRAKFPTFESMLTPNNLAFMLAKAVLWMFTIMKLECRHATLRRRLMLSSFTWLPNLDQVGADWMAMRARAIGQGSLHESLPWLEDSEAEDESKGHKRPGGPYRAFMSHWWSNRRGTNDEANTRYRLVKLEKGPEWWEWVRLGKEGTMAANAGGTTFRGRAKAKANPQVPPLIALLRVRIFAICSRIFLSLFISALTLSLSLSLSLFLSLFFLFSLTLATWSVVAHPLAFPHSTFSLHLLSLILRLFCGHVSFDITFVAHLCKVAPRQDAEAWFAFRVL